MSHYNLPINLQLINGVQAFPIVCIFVTVGIPTFLSGPRSYVWKVVLRNAEWSRHCGRPACPAVVIRAQSYQQTNSSPLLRLSKKPILEVLGPDIPRSGSPLNIFS